MKIFSILFEKGAFLEGTGPLTKEPSAKVNEVGPLLLYRFAIAPSLHLISYQF